MITKAQLRELKDSNNIVNLTFQVDWNETSMSRLFDILEQRIEGGCLIDIVKVTPVDFNSENNTLNVDFVLDVTDALIEEHLGDGE